MNIRNLIRRSLGTGGAMLFAATFSFADQSPTLSVTDAWLRAAPANSQVRAAYLTVHNSGAEAISLIAVGSPDFGAIEIHETFEDDGLVRMRRLDGIRIETGGRAELKPGGAHLMLFRPARALTPGETSSLRLQFDDGQALDIDIPVRRR